MVLCAPIYRFSEIFRSNDLTTKRALELRFPIRLFQPDLVMVQAFWTKEMQAHGKVIGWLPILSAREGRDVG